MHFSYTGNKYVKFVYIIIKMSVLRNVCLKNQIYKLMFLHIFIQFFL